MALYEPGRMVDTHQHLWKPSERRYEWLDSAGPLNRDFGPEDVAADLVLAGVTDTVLVQATDSYEDTLYMLSVAAVVPTVRGVVAWAAVDRAAEAEAALDLYAASPVVRGIRVLNHDYDDPRWLLRGDVTAGIRLLAPRGLTLDVLSTGPEHLATIAELAARHPELTLVLDHLGGPDIAGGGWEGWAAGLADVAARPNVSVKLSGLSTVCSPEWTWRDWAPYVDHALAYFGASRMMLGSDWPVSTLQGDFTGVWMAQREVISRLSPHEQDQILFATAVRTYSLDA
jgi:L-fuconolactonase